MANKMDIEAALAQLEAGKFSFRMIDSIKEHIEKGESELNVIRDMHATAMREIAIKDYAIYRLECELIKTNTRLNNTIRANALVEKSLHALNICGSKLNTYLYELKEQIIYFYEKATSPETISMANDYVDAMKKQSIALYEKVTSPETVSMVNNYIDVLKRQGTTLYEKATCPETASMVNNYIDAIKKQSISLYEKAKTQVSGLHKSLR
jgi:hypothetical protein